MQPSDWINVKDIACFLLRLGPRRGRRTLLLPHFDEQASEHNGHTNPLHRFEMMVVDKNRKKHSEHFACNLKLANSRASRTVMDTSVRLPNRSSVSKIAI